MANAILAFPDYVLASPAFATVVFSGGAWLPELPLANLLNPALSYVARSVDVSPGSTQFWVDLGVLRDVSGIFIPRIGGATMQCLYRIRGFAAMSTASPVLADTGWRSLWGDIYPPGTVNWGSPSVWDGKIGAEEAVYYSMPIVDVVSVTAQYWLVEIDDRTNLTGFIDIPRIVIAGGWQPRLNMSWGASLVTEDPSVPQEALGGALYFSSRPMRRVVRFSLGFMQEQEALTTVADMQRRLGVSGQLFFVHDPADVTNMHRRSFLARMRTLSPLEYAGYNDTTAPFELLEVIA